MTVTTPPNQASSNGATNELTDGESSTMAISSIINQSAATARPTTASIRPGIVDAAAAELFSAQMGTKTAGSFVERQQATDEQLKSLPTVEVARLRQKWGNDDVGFREEAHQSVAFDKTFQDNIMRQMLQDSFKRLQERVIEVRS